jgi:hypothetical protein
VNRVKVGFFSLTGHSETGDDRPYLEWHQLDHMPEQYQLHGLVAGQRWGSTPACRAARAAEAGDWSSIEHVVLYLMGNPVDETIDEFLTFGRHLAELGRFPHNLPSRYRGALRLLETHAAARVLISPEVVPFRPHRGIYLIVDEPVERDRPTQDAYLQRRHRELLPELVSVPGVAGAWSFATTPAIRRPAFTEGDHRMTVCYLDDEPAAVGERLAPLMTRWAADEPIRLALAAPFESMVRWDWERFGPSR